MIAERATGLLHGMEDHNKGKLAFQDDQLQQLLVDHQSERRSMLLRQHHQLANHRLALLINHERKPNKRLNEFSKEEQDYYQAQLTLLEQQNNQRFLKMLDRNRKIGDGYHAYSLHQVSFPISLTYLGHNSPVMEV